MRKLYRSILTTPHGRMAALTSREGLCALEFTSKERQELLNRRLNRYFKNYDIIDGDNDIIEKVKEWLDFYFAAEFEQLYLPPFDLRGTEFELKVWQALLAIPLGQTKTYRSLAGELGKPGASRAVGGASRRNPVSIIVPCHRVIGSSGSLVGYGGGLEMKKALLAHESR